MKKLIGKSVVTAVVAIVLMPGLVVGCGQSVSSGTQVVSAAPEYRSSNIQTIVTGPDGQRVVSNSADGSLMNLDGSPYQPMMMPDTSPSAPAAPSFPILRKVYGYGDAGTLQFDMDGNLIVLEGNNANAVTPGVYTVYPDGLQAPEGSVTTLGGTVLVPVTDASVAEPITTSGRIGQVEPDVARLEAMRVGAWMAFEYAQNIGDAETLNGLYAAALQMDETVEALIQEESQPRSSEPAVEVQTIVDATFTQEEDQRLLRDLNDAQLAAEIQISAGQMDSNLAVFTLQAIEDARAIIMKRLGYTLK